MQDMYSARPLAGRRFALDLRPTRPLTFLGPIWAVVCGVLASGGVTLRGQSLVNIIFLLLLCDPLLGAWRALWLGPEWRESVRRAWANMPAWFSASDAADRLPMRLYHQVARRITYFRKIIMPLIDSEIFGMATAGGLAVCVAAVLGQTPLMFTLVAMVIALIEGQVKAERSAGWRALFEITFPWLIAQSAFGYFSWFSVVFVILFTLTYRAWLGLEARQTHWIVWSNLAQLAIGLILFASNAPAGAGIAALGLLAQVLWQARYRIDQDGRAFAQRAQSYVLVAMLISGLSLWF